MIAGRLEIQLLANLARLASDMSSAKGMVGKAMGDVERMVGKANAALGLLGAGVSVGALVLLGKSTLDTIAKFKDLGQEAGTTASAISRFEAPARLAGSSLDAVAQAIFKMSKAALEAKDPTSNAAQALRAIGVSTEQLKGLKPDEMFELVARSVAKYRDGLEKNSIMQTLFSKSGKEMNRVVAEIVEAKKLVATVTDEEAEAADRLQDQMVVLKMESEKLWRSIMSDALPALNEIVKAFADAKKEGGLLNGIIGGLAEAFAQIKGVGLEADLRRINEQIKEAQAAAKSLEETGPTILGIERTGTIEQAKTLNALLLIRKSIEKEIFDQELAAQSKRALSGMKPMKPIAIFDPEAAKAAKAGEELLLRLEAEYAKLNDVTKENVTLEKTLAELKKAAFAKLSPELRKRIVDEAKLIDALQEQLRIEKFLADLHDEDLKAAEKRGEDIEALANSWADASVALEQEAKLIGLSNLERQKALLLEKARNDIAAAGGSAAAIRDINAELAIQLELLQKIDDSERQVDVWDEISSRVADIATGIRDWKDALQDFIKELMWLFAKKLILQIAAGVTGSSALGSAAASVGGNSLGGMVMNAAGNYVSNTAVGAAVGGAYTSFMAGYSGATLAAGVAGPTTAGATGFMGAGQWMATLGSTGWGLIIVAAIAVVGALVSRNRVGGPKPGGSSYGGYDESGTYTGDLSVPGTDNGRFFTPSNGDPIARQIASATAAGFYQTLERFGGTAAGMRFGFGYDQDPAGSADNRVSSLVADASGRVLYSQTLTAGRDDEDLNRATAIVTRRAILAALQASELPAGISAILGLVDATSGTADEIDAIMALAETFMTLTESLADLDVDSILEVAGRNSVEALSAQGTALEELASRTTITTDSMQGLTAAANEFRSSAAQLILQIRQARIEINAMFGQTSQNIQLSTMTPQQQYDFYQAETERLYGELATAKSPEEVLRISGQINQNVNASWNLLDPSEQAARQQEFLDGIERARVAADLRLTQLQETVVTNTNAALDRIEKLMTDLALKNAEAANKQGVAADKQIRAADTPREITIKLDLSTGLAVVTDGD